MDSLQLSPIAYGDQHALQAQAVYLYDLLKERDPVANISHREAPAFFQHMAFINSRPYSAWEIIERATLGPESAGDFSWSPIGSIYLTKQDEIGLFLTKEFQGKGYGQVALAKFLQKHPRKRYLANIAPGNLGSKRFFARRGFTPVQETFELRIG